MDWRVLSRLVPAIWMLNGGAFANACKLLESRIPIYPNSIASLQSELVNPVFQLELLIEKPDVFSRDFLKVNQRPATPDDLANYFKNHFLTLEQTVQQIAIALGESNSHLKQQLSTRLNELSRSVKGAFEKIRTQSTLQAAELKGVGVEGDIRGFIGEVSGLLNLPNVTEYSVNLDSLPGVREAIETRFENLRDAMKRRRVSIREIEERYPHIIAHARELRNRELPETQRNSTPSPKELLMYAERRLKQKQIDYVLTHGGKEYWVELKYNSSPVNVKPRKLDQLEEDLEILAFLGLRKSLPLIYIFRGGVSEDMAKIFKQKNVPFVDMTGARGTSLDLIFSPAP